MIKPYMPILGLLLACAASPVWAEEDMRTLVKAMKAQMLELAQQVEHSNARIAELEKQLAHAQAQKPQTNPTTPNSKTTVSSQPAPAQKEPSPPVTLGDTKGTFKIPGTDASLGFGGFVKLDAIYNDVSAGSNKIGNQALIVSQIPLAGQGPGAHSQILFNPKETRFWLKSFMPTAWGDVGAYVELDFYGSSETYNYAPRLRHAYGTIGNFMVGQNWTTFLNVLAIPDTLDLNGPVGNVVYIRQPQMRWTQPFTVVGMPFDVEVAAEAPRSRFWAASQNNESADGYGFAYPDDDRYPDMIARLNFNPDWGTFSLSAMTRQIRYAKANGNQREAWGGAVSLAGKFRTFDIDNIRFSLNYGDVFGRYASLNTFEDAALDASGNLRLVNVYGGMVAYQHWWDKAWRSTIAYGFEQADHPATVSGGMTRQAQSVHVNLLWSPVLQATFGLEYIYATRELIDRRDGELSRVQFSSRFNF